MMTIKSPLNTFTGTAFSVVDVVGRAVTVIRPVVVVVVAVVVVAEAGVVDRFSVVIATSCEVDRCLVVTPVVARATVVVGPPSAAHTKSKLSRCWAADKYKWLLYSDYTCNWQTYTHPNHQLSSIAVVPVL